MKTTNHSINIISTSGKKVITFNKNGTIEMNEGYSPTEAGEALLDALVNLGLVVKRIKTEVEIVCSIPDDKRYSCVICNTKIHNGQDGCVCSTLRKETFDYASICVKCAKAFDRLMADEELKPILEHLMHKAFWHGNGSVIDF